MRVVTIETPSGPRKEVRRVLLDEKSVPRIFALSREAQWLEQEIAERRSALVLLSPSPR